MKKTRRSQPKGMGFHGKKKLSQAKVRPVTSHGLVKTAIKSPADKKPFPASNRPKTALGLRARERTNQKLIVSNEDRSGRIREKKIFPEIVFSIAADERDRSISISSEPAKVTTPRRRSRTRSHTVSETVPDVNRSGKHNRPLTKPLTKSNISSNKYPVHRKVAWLSDTQSQEFQYPEMSNDRRLVTDGKVQFYEGGVKENKDEYEEPEKDIFHPPELTVEDSGNEYETELEENAPVVVKQFDSSGKRTYLSLCKQEDIVPVSGLTNQFMEKEMVVRHRGLGWKGTKPLAKSLVKNVFVEKLDLADNYAEGVGATLVATMLVDNCYITELNLSQNFIRAEGGIALAEMLTKNQVLRKVILRANHLTDRVAKSFAETLRENRTLRHLDLSHNEIGEQGAVYLGAGLALNYGLKQLNLSWNYIRGKGGVAMAQALKTNDSLTTLDLSWNGISLLGCVALGKFLRKNENIQELDLRNNRIGYLGAQRICPGISKNSSLEELKMGLNPVGDDGVEALLKAVKKNKSLKVFSLEEVTVSSKAYQDIQQLQQNRQIKIITGGLGGFKKPKEMPQQMAILLDFIKVNRLRLVDWFFQFDKDRSGDISKDEFKIGLKETGLKMTQKQLDSLIEYLDVDNNGKIEYNELLIGRDHTLREQRDFRMAQQKLRNIEDMRARLPKVEGFEQE